MKYGAGVHDEQHAAKSNWKESANAALVLERERRLEPQGPMPIRCKAKPCRDFRSVRSGRLLDLAAVSACHRMAVTHPAPNGSGSLLSHSDSAGRKADGLLWLDPHCAG